ncbi:hypothetical protein HGD77_01295 [Acinetobacter sp. NEB149]|uniref:hypothetical protein n=1 Tax=Acinetobacter sp. NEB149 TaxID=2725684 RepID=UPI001449EBE7|nr:hypothetical protein [Acinetobacter sp. NEB149]QJB47494.1 hypothetical protein HGD77_01295 [Acinetobacter sp. NEB149]
MGQNILADLEKMGIQLQTENEQVVYSEGLASKSILKISNGYSFIKSLSCDQDWKSYQAKVLAHLRTLDEANARQELSQIDYQDWQWKWINKTYHTKTDNCNEWFYLEIDSKVEAACLIYYPKNSYLHPLESIFYVEYLAVAPWNRYTPLEEQRNKGLGSLLLLKAINYLAIKYNTSGRFSLHSLMQAEGYYVNRLKMQHVETQDKPQLKYFELPEHEVSNIIGAVA